MINGDARKAEVEQAVPKTETPLVPDIEWRSSAKGVAEAYSNFVNIHWLQDDLILHFAQLVPDAKGPYSASWTIEERIAVTLSWARAKDLRDLLVEVIAKYEQKNGEIRHGIIP